MSRRAHYAAARHHWRSKLHLFRSRILARVVSSPQRLVARAHSISIRMEIKFLGGVGDRMVEMD